MAVVADLVESRDFCSVNAQALGADPLGTAPMYDEFIMVEFDLPWHRNVVQTEGFPEEVTAAVERAKEAGRRVQVHAFAPHEEYSQDGKRRLMYFRLERGEYISRQYVGVEYVVSPEDVGTLARFLLHGEGDESVWAEARVERDGIRDLFVCTHGARDRCCGKFGAVAHMELDKLARDGSGAGAADAGRADASGADASGADAGGADASRAENGATRVWRVNHIGGHRFSPTLLELPTGRYWGSVPEDAYGTLLDDPANPLLRPYYRGWSVLGSLEEQIADGEVWRRIGAAWLTYDKQISVGDTTDDGVEVLVNWVDPQTGNEGQIELTVQIGEVLTLPESCGKDDVQSQQYVVSRYEEKSS